MSFSSTNCPSGRRGGRGEKRPPLAAGVTMAPPILVLSAVSSSSLPPEPEGGIRVVSAERLIHVTGPIARVTLTLEVQNAAAASHESQVLLAFAPWEVERLAIVKATRVEGKHRKKAYEPLLVQASDPPATTNGARLYSVLLSTHLKPGDSTTLEVVYVLTNVLDPYPAKAVNPSSESQLVYYHNTAVLLSPYHVLEQVTYIRLPSDRIDTITRVDPTSRAGAEIKYGTYYNQMPMTYLPISLHYENRPFFVLEKLERKVDITCQGDIKVTDQYKMRHDGAWYERIFLWLAETSSWCQRIFTSPECPRIWPSAHTLLSSKKGRLYHTLIQGSRYGWHCTFTAGYAFPLDEFLFETVEGRRYINLTFTFEFPLPDTVVEDFTTTVLLPEGSKNPQPIFSFPTETIFRRTYWERFWAWLLRDDKKETIRLAGRAVEVVALDIYPRMD